MPTDTTARPFSARIREASWTKHQSLDPTAGKPSRPGVFDRLFDGTLALTDYTRWHAQQYFVYLALESAGELWRDDAVAGPFVRDELLRLESVTADLEFLIGPGWPAVVDPLPSTRRYVERIEEEARTRPGGYIAHSYTRYLGDLSGGQAFGKAAVKAYGFDDAGVRFYRFDIADLKAFKDDYRARLDELELDEADRRRLVDEVLVAYDHNGAVLAELAEGLGDGSNPFDPAAITAVCRHMNDDHADDTLVICRGAGGRPEADSARMTAMDGDGADFTVTVEGREERIRIPWARRLTERAEVRPEVVRLFTESRRVLQSRGDER